MSWWSLLRTFGTLSGIAIALLTTATLPVSVFWSGWHALYRFNEGLSGRWGNTELMTLVMDHLPLVTLNLPLAPPPEPEWILTVTGWLFVPLVAGLAAIQLFIPLKHRIHSISGHEPIALDPTNPYQSYVDEIARRHRIGPIQVYTIALPGIKAFALSSSWRSHAVVVSQEVLSALPEAQRRWVLAHEVGHIHYGDTRSATLMLLAMRGVVLLAQIKARISRSTIILMARTPVLRLIALPVALVYSLLALIGRVGRGIGGSLFLLTDRFAGRKMEYRADRFAARLVGAQPGIVLFEGLSGSFEPHFQWFATHPSAKQRIAALSRLM